MHKVFKNKAQRCSTPLKGLGMIFSGQENPLIIFRSKERYIWIKRNNKIQRNYKEKGVLASFILGSSVLFAKILVVLCVVQLKEKKYDFWKLKKLTYKHNTIIKNGQVHHWSLKIKIYMIYF